MEPTWKSTRKDRPAAGGFRLERIVMREQGSGATQAREGLQRPCEFTERTVRIARMNLLNSSTILIEIFGKSTA